MSARVEWRVRSTHRTMLCRRYSCTIRSRMAVKVCAERTHVYGTGVAMAGQDGRVSCSRVSDIERVPVVVQCEPTRTRCSLRFAPVCANENAGEIPCESGKHLVRAEKNIFCSAIFLCIPMYSVLIENCMKRVLTARKCVRKMQ